MVIAIVLSCFTSLAQTSASEDVKLYYRSSFALGAQAHTAGFGINFKKNQHLSYKVKRFYSIELLNLRHPKQNKVFTSGADNSRGYHYGKINHFFTTRIGIGQQHAVALKELKKGVQLAWVYSFGASIGILKPIYVKIYDVNNQPSGVRTVRYDPNVHRSVLGGASFFNGFDGLSLVPGAYGKFGINFENSPYDDRLKSIETGIALDAYFKEVPLMYEGQNNSFWLTFYVLFEFGKKIE
jgi:hypothetical protein